MYFVMIDFAQLHTRLSLSAGRYTTDVDHWLRDRGFTPAEAGWYATADAMNTLSCSEILFSERRATADVIEPPAILSS